MSPRPSRSSRSSAGRLPSPSPNHSASRPVLPPSWRPARRPLGWILLLAILAVGPGGPAGTLAAADPVGIVLQVGGESRLLREGQEQPLTRGLALLPGDVLIKGPGAGDPEVRWWPYAAFAPGPTADRLVVAFNPPGSGQRQGMLAQLKGYMGFVESEYEEVAGVSDQGAQIQREEHPEFEEKGAPAQNSAAGDEAAGFLPPGAEAAPAEGGPTSAMDASPPPPAAAKAAEGAVPQSRLGASPGRLSRPIPPRPRRQPVLPGAFATLLPKTPVQFGGRADAGVAAAGEASVTPAGSVAMASPASLTLVIVEPGGRTLLSRDLPAGGPLTILPGQVGFEPGRVYTWRIAGPGSAAGGAATGEGQLRLLAEPHYSAIRADMASIASAAADSRQQLLEQIAYLQLASDLQPSEVDLYWLSGQLLALLARQHPDAPEMARWRQRLRRHLEKTASR